MKHEANDTDDSPLKNLAGTHVPFIFPADYFQLLSESIYLRLGLIEPSRFSRELSTKAPFEIPSGYFETFPQRIQERLNDLETFEPDINLPAFETGLVVPSQYFSVPKTIIPLQTHKKVYMLHAIRYVAAAAVIVISFALGYWVNHADNTEYEAHVLPAKKSQQLLSEFEKMSKQEIIEALKALEMDEEIYTLAHIARSPVKPVNQESETIPEVKTGKREMEQFLLENLDETSIEDL